VCNKILGICISIVLSGAAWANESLPDPTRPLEYSGVRQAQPQQLVLNSILISGERKIAVINGQQLIESQWIADKQVIRIHSDSVTLRHQGQTIVLTLYGKTVRQ